MKYILYGAGKYGIIAMHYFGKENIKCFCETYKKNDFIEGISVIGVEELESYVEDAKVLISVTKSKYALEIARILNRMNIEYESWEAEAEKLLLEEEQRYSKINQRDSFRYEKEYEYLITEDKYDDAGLINSYFWQDLWAARHIFDNRLGMHYDIGSRVDGFIAHLLAFKQNVTLIDIRPLKVDVDGLAFIRADATNLDGIEDESIESLSALCSLEHFGLGRYGDPIDPEACFKCFEAIQRKIKRGGNLYISVPVGKEHLEYNAHRVFYAETITKAFNKMDLLEYSTCYMNEIERNVDINKYDDSTEKGGNRFGLFWFRKK